MEFNSAFKKLKLFSHLCQISSQFLFEFAVSLCYLAVPSH